MVEEIHSITQDPDLVDIKQSVPLETEDEQVEPENIVLRWKEPMATIEMLLPKIEGIAIEGCY